MDDTADGIPRSGVFVVFGATGDPANKNIFPALQAMTRRSHLDTPVVSVGRPKWSLDQVKDSESSVAEA